MNAARSARAERGASLIQVLIGMAIGVSLIGALGTYFIQGSRSSREDINIASMLNELGYASGQLTLDLEMAGFWAQVHDPSAIELDGTLAISGTDCGAAGWFRNLRTLEMLDNTTGASGDRPATQFPCLPAADVVPGTDIIAIKRVYGRIAGTDTATTDLRNGTMYLRTHERFGRLYLHGGGAPGAIATPWQNWEYAPAVYFVQSYTTTAGDGIPALCRRVLRSASGGAPAFATDCVAQGVENLQVEIGVDSDEDGTPNFFTPSPTQGQLNTAATARIYLLVRTVRADQNYYNDKTYELGNAAAFTPSGAARHYFRKTLATEVALRNPRGLQGVAVQ
jgi:type IV pilus assembly protein PilW